MIDPMSWGCAESRGTVAHVRWQYRGKCNEGNAILRVGKTVDALARGSGEGDECQSEGAVLDELTVIAMLDVDGDGSVEPLVMRNHHEVTDSRRVWIFVAGHTPQPHMELHWRHVGRTKVQLVSTQRGFVVHVGGRESVFLEVLTSGVVTNGTQPAMTRTAAVRGHEKVIDEATSYVETARDDTAGPGRRSWARGALRRAGVDDAAILRVLGPEAPAEARERILRFASEAGKETKDDVDDGSEGLCEQPTVVTETPWQIPAWGPCVIPAKATRDRVEPAIPSLSGGRIRGPSLRSAASTTSCTCSA